MASTLTCDACGKPMEIGWRCYPAKVEGRALAGTVMTRQETEGGDVIEQGAPIGPGVDICTGCIKVKHPLAQKAKK